MWKWKIKDGWLTTVHAMRMVSQELISGGVEVVYSGLTYAAASTHA